MHTFNLGFLTGLTLIFLNPVDFEYTANHQVSFVFKLMVKVGLVNGLFLKSALIT